MHRRGVRFVVVALVVALVVPAGIEPAEAAKRVSSKKLFKELKVKNEHRSGYSRSKFKHWIDKDGDGCDTRREVLINEATKKPRMKSGCKLKGGKWRSRYDGKKTRDPSTFDVDHLIPLKEAWQSGAWRWNGKTRKRFANDLGYKASLIAVSASSNRSKGAREPHNWLPPRARYECRYVADWVAVKWRWKLKVQRKEKRFLRKTLRDCDWPKVKKPMRAKIKHPGDGGGDADCDPSYPTVCIPPPPPDLNCGDIEHRDFVVDGDDPHRFDGDGDGVGCES